MAAGVTFHKVALLLNAFPAKEGIVGKKDISLKTYLKDTARDGTGEPIDN